MPEELTPPKNRESATEYLGEMSENGQIAFCQSQGWCVPNLYPFVFRHNNVGSAHLFSSSTANTNSVHLLREFLKDKSCISLPRNIIIRDEEHHIHAYLTEDLLTPPIAEGFNVAVTSNCLVVTLSTACSTVGVGRGVSGSGGGGGGGGGSDDSDSDGEAHNADAVEFDP